MGICSLIFREIQPESGRHHGNFFSFCRGQMILVLRCEWQFQFLRHAQIFCVVGGQLMLFSQRADRRQICQLRRFPASCRLRPPAIRACWKRMRREAAPAFGEKPAPKASRSRSWKSARIRCRRLVAPRGKTSLVLLFARVQVPPDCRAQPRRFLRNPGGFRHHLRIRRLARPPVGKHPKQRRQRLNAPQRHRESD